jgi:hypothetical protein
MMEPGEPFCERHDTLMKISAVNIDGCLLFSHSAYDGRIGVPNAGHVVVHVDKASPIRIVQIHAFTANYFKRRVIKKFRAQTQSEIPAVLQRSCGQNRSSFCQMLTTLYAML